MTIQQDRGAYLATLPSSPKDRVAAFYSVSISFCLFAAAAPFARVKFPPVPAFIASYQSSLSVVYIVTAILLYSQFAVLRSSSILYLASGYLFTATVVAGYALTYIDLFASTGLFNPGPETTVWFYLIWHGALPFFAVLYALSTPHKVKFKSAQSARTAVILNVTGVFVAAVGLLLFLTAGHPSLPRLMDGTTFTLVMNLILSSIFGMCAISLGLLLKRKPHSVLDIWLMVILCAWIFDISLSAVLNAARFDFGFYAGRIYGLFAAVGILGILLAEIAGIQLRLSYLMRQQARESAYELKEYVDRERLFSAAVRSSNDAIITKSLDGTITGWNAAAERLFGFSANEAIGRSIDIIVPDERRTEVGRILRDVRDGHVVENRETVRVSKDGRLIDVSLSISPVRSDTGETIGAAKVVRDITEQKLNAEKFRLAVDASPSGLVMIDTGGQMMLVNSETERLFGYTREELLGQTVDMLLPGELRTLHASWRAGYADGPTTRRMGADLELLGQRKTGERFPLEIGLNPISTRTGTLVLAVIVDISARKKAEQALHESERMAKRILDMALDGFIQFNSSLEVIDANRQARVIFGTTRDEFLGRSVLDLLFPNPDDTPVPPEFLDDLTRDSKGSSGSRFEIATLARSGRLLTLELSVTHYLRDGDKIFNAFVRDLTEQRAAEATFRQAQKMEAIGQLTGGVAHDFNNILTVITGTIELLSQGVADRPQLATIAKLIDSAATRGADLTRHLLAFSRNQPLQPRRVEVNGLVLEAVELLRPTLAQVTIALDICADTWPALVDPSQLTTAILNLALNARDASRTGGVLTVTTGNAVYTDTPALQGPDVMLGDYVFVEVADNGKGMDQETLTRAFEPFFTTKGIGEGTGLGLSMVYGFVKQSNGHVTISSELGRGTSVRLFLPKADHIRTAGEVESPAGMLQRGTETILIVEDDILVRTYVTSQIEALGYRTLVAVDGESALRVLRTEDKIDLLFTDFLLTGAMNGGQIANEAIRLRSGLRVLFTTGYTGDPSIRDSLIEGEIMLLTKPYRPAELARAIRDALA